MEAIFRLAWLRDDSTIVPVNWRDMETEELGSVYEGLLELTPRLTLDGRGFAFAEGAETKGNERKKSGSYYTPDSLVQALLDSALDPVLDRIESVTVIDPACGSGHFLLAAARRIATRVARVRTGGVPSAADYRHALRDAVRCCVHGVDRNPMAIELARVALWIETVEPGKPLGFLDANLRVGDSLLGIFDLKALEKGIPDAAYKPLTGDERATANDFLRRNRSDKGVTQDIFDFAGGGTRVRKVTLPDLAASLRAVRQLPEDTLDEITAKRLKYRDAHSDARLTSLEQAADLYIAAFLAPKTKGASLDLHTADHRGCLEGNARQHRLRPTPGCITQAFIGCSHIPLAHRVPGCDELGRIRCSARQPSLGTDQDSGTRVLRLARAGDCRSTQRSRTCSNDRKIEAG